MADVLLTPAGEAELAANPGGWFDDWLTAPEPRRNWLDWIWDDG